RAPFSCRPWLATGEGDASLMGMGASLAAMKLLINGVHLNYTAAGSHTSPPLMLLHGFTGSAVNWLNNTVVFSQHFRTVAVDALGHGESDSPNDPARYRMEHCIADLATLLDVLNIDNAHILGYSMGGRVALHLAASHPQRVRSLILESPSPGIADAAERAARVQSDNALADFIEREGMEAFVNRWEALPLFATQARLPDSVRVALRAQRLHNNPHGLANSLRGLGTGIQSPLWERLPELRTPTLLLAGADDAKFTTIASAMAQSLPMAQLAIVPNAGHTVHLEQPNTFDMKVLEFLRSYL
ncbi:MAG: 2-succinyl-6-hydroxy-2,4-cyclohexadiene-1-carboxylate synthase, partial [Anaerolineales bacterium]